MTGITLTNGVCAATVLPYSGPVAAIVNPIVTVVRPVAFEGPRGPAGAQGPKGDDGPQGPPGTTTITVTADTNLSGHRAVRWATPTRVDYASAADPSRAWTIGITLGAATAGAPVEVETLGLVTEPSWSWDPNALVFLGVDGVLTQIPPEAPALSCRVVVGRAVSSTSLWVHTDSPIRLIA